MHPLCITISLSFWNTLLELFVSQLFDIFRENRKFGDPRSVLICLPCQLFRLVCELSVQKIKDVNYHWLEINPCCQMLFKYTLMEWGQSRHVGSMFAGDVYRWKTKSRLISVCISSSCFSFALSPVSSRVRAVHVSRTRMPLGRKTREHSCRCSVFQCCF